MGHLLLIGVGGFAGAAARYLVDGRVTAWAGTTLPWGTLAVNVSGSFALGLLFALITERAALSADLRGPLMIGFVGSFTTFSTLTLETWRMIEDGAWIYAGLNIGGSLLLGLGAVIGGIALGRAV
jgi:fluoride exporter